MSLLPKRKITVSFDQSTVVVTTLVVVGVLILVEFLHDLMPVLTLVVVAGFLAITLNPAVSKITHHLPSKNRGLATGAAFVTVVTFIVLFFTLTLPPIAKQFSQFAADLPATVETFKAQDNFASNLVNRYDLDTEISNTAKDIATRAAGVDGGLRGAISKATTAIINIIAVLIMTFMMVVEGPNILKRAEKFIDPSKLAKRRRLLKQMYEVIIGYVNGQLIIAVIAAAVALVVMVVLRVPNALAMAGIVALFGLVPLIGATLAAAIVVIATLLVSVKLAIVMAVFFVIYQQIENATIQPYIQGKKSSLSALTVFIVALIGVNIAGIFGAFIAIPIAGCLKILVDDYFKSSRVRVAK